ncbi:latent transforming growth factor beta-binding protein [Corallococcus carmarthensis]|uniref:Latent transforming growth factor beta-binding protein n=1 Tax=Corallococcus carmarthensis TaxID=2316728 RepID=A0A3A8K972_9BACT|nr:latent transforming growth factor beta-binding protein [Corallococcus carmarthensis]
MRFSLSFLLVLLVLVVGPGCPLDIQVREAPDAGCSESSCSSPCDADRECPAGQRCNLFFKDCEDGPRLTEPCSAATSCSGNARCTGGRCVQGCGQGCPVGYLCGPESTCVETCEGMTPATLGSYCTTSMDCTRCGFCADSGSGKKCHQPCRSDAECPDAKPGACVLLPGSTLRVCQP